MSFPQGLLVDGEDALREPLLLNGFPYSVEVCFVAYMLVFFHR